MIWVVAVLSVLVLINLAIYLWAQFLDIPGEW